MPSFGRFRPFKPPKSGQRTVLSVESCERLYPLKWPRQVRTGATMMQPTRIAVAAVAAVALVAGAGVGAAAPGSGNAPDDAGPGSAGPPTDMPGPVPDFVGEIHRTIGEFLDGSIDSLGSAVSDLTPGEESTEGGA